MNAVRATASPHADFDRFDAARQRDEDRAKDAAARVTHADFHELAKSLAFDLVRNPDSTTLAIIIEGAMKEHNYNGDTPMGATDYVTYERTLDELTERMILESEA